MWKYIVVSGLVMTSLLLLPRMAAAGGHHGGGHGPRGYRNVDQWLQSLPEEQQVSIDAFFRMLEANKYKIQYRVMLARYRGKTVCPDCHGTRLKQQASYVKIGGRAITELVDMPVEELQHFFSNLQLSDTEKRISERIIKEINGRLRYLVNVGLGYLTLNRPSNTLSGGESQRISLATS